jgi:hypothetical protein
MPRRRPRFTPAGALDQRPAPSHELRRRIASMRAAGRRGRHSPPSSGSPNRPPSTTPSASPDRRMPRYRPVVATLTLAGPRARALRAQLRARRPRPPRGSRARRQDAGGGAARRHPRRPPGLARRGFRAARPVPTSPVAPRAAPVGPKNEQLARRGPGTATGAAGTTRDRAPARLSEKRARLT